jgi:hypothetical protein
MLMWILFLHPIANVVCIAKFNKIVKALHMAFFIEFIQNPA